MKRIDSTTATRAVDQRVLAHIAKWGGMHRPDDITAETWSRSLARLARAGRLHFDRGWRIVK